MTNPKKQVLNLRTQVIQAALEADIPLDDWDRARVLGPIAGLLAVHPKIAGQIAFKGGAIMHLIDGSPRFSKDLDAVMVSGGPVTKEVVTQALSTAEAKLVVLGIGKAYRTPVSITVPVVACHPLSGKNKVNLQLSINWSAPLQRKVEPRTITIRGRKSDILVVARVERMAEKVRAFLVRGRPGDAFDLYHFAKKGRSVAERQDLPGLVATKLAEDDDVPSDRSLLVVFDGWVNILAGGAWEKAALVMKGKRPLWTEVEPRVNSFRLNVPETRPARSR